MNFIMRNRLSKVLFLIVLFSITNFSIALAQSAGSTSASFTGFVIDENGTAITAAEIIVKEIDTNLTRQSFSSDAGSFLFSQLSPGNYEVMVKADGFKTITSRYTFLLGTTTLSKFSMVLGRFIFRRR